MPPNIVLLEPEPEETLHSVLITGWRLSAYYTFPFFTKSIFNQVTDGRGWSWNYKRICPYFDPCRATASALLSRTLQLPYVVPFLSPATANAGFRRLDGDRRLPKSDTDAAWRPFLNHPLKYCPKCVQVQISRLHRSFWLRPHQLDSVEVCWRHGIRLVGATPFHGRSLFPHEYSDQTMIPCRNFADLWLARQSYELLRGNHAASEPWVRQAVYRKQATRIGYCSRKRIDFHTMATHLLETFGKDFFHKVMRTTEAKHIASRLRNTVLGEDTCVRPIYHLLCIQVLFGDQHLFFQRVRNEAGHSREVSLHKRNPTCGHQSTIHRRIFLSQLMSDGPDVMNALAKRSPLSHSWILQHALTWSRRRISEVLYGADRDRIIRKQADDLHGKSEQERNELKRRLEETGHLTEKHHSSDSDLIVGSPSIRRGFESITSFLTKPHCGLGQMDWSASSTSCASAPSSHAYLSQEQWAFVGDHLAQ